MNTSSGEAKYSSRKDEIKRLLSRYVEIVDSPRNREAARLWQDMPFSYCVNKYLDIPGDDVLGRVPVICDPGNGLHRQRLGYDVKDYYTDPETFLWAMLNNLVYHFENIDDDRWFKPRIGIWLSATWEATLFGKATGYSATEDPWPAPEFPLASREDLDRLEPPDFYQSGLMPLAHQFYSELSEMVKGYPVTVEFPGWQRSPWGVAFAIRGVSNLVYDAYDDPVYLAKLMSFITACRKTWYRDAEAFLGRRITPAPMLNDEVHVPTVSPGFYEQYILPSEMELSDFHGGLYCWHSCGDCTPMLHLIRRIPNLRSLSVNVGTWDLGKLAAVFSDAALEICVPPTSHVLGATEPEMRAMTTAIVNTCKEHGARRYFLRANALQGTGEGNWQRDFQQIQLWVRTAKDVVAQGS